jgi:hypothetical protein
MNSGLKQYHAEVQKFLHLSRKKSRLLLEHIVCGIQESEEDIEKVTYEQIRDCLGEPEELAKTYIETENLSDFSRSYVKKQRIHTVFFAVLIVAILAALSIFAFETFHKYKYGYFVEMEPYEITSETILYTEYF